MDTFFRLQVYQRVGTRWSIWPSIGKSVISVGKKGSKGLTDAFYGWKKSRKRSGLGFIHILKTVHLRQLKGMQSSKIGMWKGHHLSLEGIRKGYLLCQKWYRKSKGAGLSGAYGVAPPPPHVNLSRTTPINRKESGLNGTLFSVQPNPMVSVKLLYVRENAKAVNSLD